MVILGMDFSSHPHTNHRLLYCMIECEKLFFSDRLDPVMDTLDKKVVEWKFSEFDKDTDNRLSRKEVKSLRRLVKKFIKPRACAKSFLKYCDSNHDKFIERREWSLCLGVDINSEYK